MEWRENALRIHIFIEDVSPTPSEFSFPKPTWVRHKRLQTGVGLFRSEMHKRCMASTAACESGAKEQTDEHIITSFSLYHHPNGARALSDVDKNLATWLIGKCPVI